MIYLNKILPVFVSPIFIVLICLVIGVLTRRRTWVITGVVLLYIASLPIAVDFLVSGRDRGFERLLPAYAPNSEAIVVLGQGMSWLKVKNSYVPDWGDPDRFFGGVELILANKAPKLVFTGGKLPWQQSDQTEGEVLSRYAQMMQVPANKILVTETVENTEQEAQAVRKVLGQATKRIILVTSGFHMQRAKALFEQGGFEVFAYPVDVTGQTTEKITAINFLPNADALARSSLTVREYLGRFYYYLKHVIVSIEHKQ